MTLYYKKKHPLTPGFLTPEQGDIANYIYRTTCPALTCVSLAQVIAKLNRAPRGWLTYFRYAEMKGQIKAREGWIHR